MAQFADILQSKQFVVTGELNPPKGTDTGTLLEHAARLRGWVDAVNVTDSASARMAMAPVGACWLVERAGLRTILQLTSRDRNRIALQGDVLAAAALGIENVVVMGGDPPANGDHPDAKPVFDLFASQIVAAVRGMNEGHDLGGHPLHGATKLCVGAVVNPGAADLDGEVQRMREKIAAGAQFLQTQAIFDAVAFERFLTHAGEIAVPVLAGIIPLKSPRMARYLHEKVPGISVPGALFEELNDGDATGSAGMTIAARTIAALRGLCGGVHVMAVGWEERVPEILRAAGFEPRDSAQRVQSG